MEAMHRARYGGKCGASVFSLAAPASQHPDVVTNPEALSTLLFKEYDGGFII